MSVCLTRYELNNALLRGDYILVESYAEKCEILYIMQEMGWQWTSGARPTALIPEYSPCYIHGYIRSFAPVLCLQYSEVDPYNPPRNAVVAWNRRKSAPKFMY